jgi:hypothetical protein
MRPTLLVGAVVLCALAPTVSAAPPSDETRLRAVMNRQTALFKQARWRALWQIYTPRFQRTCGYARWLRNVRRARREIGTDWTVRNQRIRIRGDRAAVTYTVVRRGRVVNTATARSPDIYVKISGRWRDELDAETTC